MKFFEIAAAALLLAASIQSGAQSAGQYHHSERIPHYDPLKTSGNNHLPRSTAIPANLGKSTSHTSELDRLEHNNSTQLLSESKRSAKSGTSSGHPIESKASDRGTPISFSYRPPQTGQMYRTSAPGSRRH